ncbi:hypothetical protein GFB56_01350 [Ensifer sp. T173]|uniref:Uncharacterized protein n=1 Tax=Ensifer canadensis TaxID=555315 RepID=A0AAW4FEK4_9HYPH|nr:MULTISPECIES: hypothetical protein [Ensifer]KQU97004.1 hypothetical protein ASD00_19450 [Ensifer sp. Root31]MBM3089466.1 hypothetical protein [Ensifer canadensis]UBI76621.1 hypothetical protein J3R84_05665 [Ensifer canadensis]
MEASANAASNAGCAPVAIDGGALITVVRLIANRLLVRLAQREIGTGAEGQMERSLRQARRIWVKMWKA